MISEVREKIFMNSVRLAQLKFLCSYAAFSLWSWVKPEYLTSTYFTVLEHGDIILKRSNNSVFLQMKIYRNRQAFDLIHFSDIWMKPETPRYQVSSYKV